MVSVLLFHEVFDEEWFDSLVGWLKNSYDLVPNSSIAGHISGLRRLDKACHLTIDDGHESFYRVIYPVLRKHKVPASLFVSPTACRERRNFWFQEIQGYCDGRLRYFAADVLGLTAQALEGFNIASIFKVMRRCQMEATIEHYIRATVTPTTAPQNLGIEELREIAESGLISIGAHTNTHPILSNEDGVDGEREIVDSIAELAVLLGQAVKSFAYPNGIPELDFGAREERILHRCGIELAFSTEMRHISTKENPLRVPRLAISDGENPKSIRTKLLLGSGWHHIKDLMGKGEWTDRQRLKRVLQSSRGGTSLAC